MADSKQAKQYSDKIFESIQKTFTKTVSNFAAALFLILGIGVLLGFTLAGTPHSWLMLAPFALALFAYYSRDFAIVALIVFFVLFMI